MDLHSACCFLKCGDVPADGKGPGAAEQSQLSSQCQHFWQKGVCEGTVCSALLVKICPAWMLIGGHDAVQVTQMIATGPKPPLSFNSSNDESPVKLNIGGGGMGEP